MDGNSKTPKNKVSNAGIYAKMKNLRMSVKEIYEIGSKQSFMTLNLQFIIFQMLGLSQSIPDNFMESNCKIKTIILNDAKTFYKDYGNKDFYLIENSIGFLHCIMVLLSKSVFGSKAVSEILKNLSVLDGSSLLQFRYNALSSILANNKVDQTMLHFEDVLQPEDELVKSFQPLASSTPKRIKVSDEDRKKNGPNTDINNKVMSELAGKPDKVILKPSPFEGNISTYFPEIVTPVKTEERSKEKKSKNG